MSTVIRHALSDRIRRLPALQEFLRDFRVATGMPVEFVDAPGRQDSARELGPLCALLRGTPEGCRLCAATMQDLSERSRTASMQTRCDLGLWETSVPLRAGGQTFGYFVFGGYFTAAPDQQEQNRIRHLLDRVGTAVPAATVSQACAGSPLMEPARHAAMARIVTLAAEHLALVITDNLAAPGEQLPPLVRAACDHARRAFTQEISLADIARSLGVTTVHLCRAFHHATGLRFREYVGRLRAEHARELLLGSELTITEVAFAAGFQSLSQFNRVFRQVHGTTPQQVRVSSGFEPRPPRVRAARVGKARRTAPIE